MTIKLAFNPFFDGNNRSTVAGHISNTGAAGARYEPLTYSEVMQRIPMGPKGLQGTLIGMGGDHGAPIDYNPHILNNVEMTVDPDVPGQSFKIKLGDINKDSLREVAAEVDAQLEANGMKQGLGRRELLKFRAANVLANVSAQTPQIREADGAEMTQPNQEYQQPQQPQQPQLQPLPSSQQMAFRPISPLASFGAQTQQPQPAQLSRIVDTSANRAPVELATPAPTKRAVIEIVGMGSFEVSYHDAIVAGESLDDHGISRPTVLILVYDTNYKQGMKYFPPSHVMQDGKAVPLQLAVVIRPNPVVYLVETTGYQYLVGSCEHCVLNVMQQGPYNG